MFDAYKVILPLAVAVVLMIGAPFLGYLVRGRRFGSDGKDSFFRYKRVQLKWHWVTMTLLLAGFINPLFFMLAIVSVPYLYRRRLRKAG